MLRLGHRSARDKRVSTHCGLVARALGADEIIYSGEEDPGLVGSVNKVKEKWGGNFKARYEKNWRGILKKFNGFKVHLTFYGAAFSKGTAQMKKERAAGKNILIIVGAEKVPREVYELSDQNVSVGNQPHSEVAALALVLYELDGRAVLDKEFAGWKVKITPNARGKTLVDKKHGRKLRD